LRPSDAENIFVRGLGSSKSRRREQDCGSPLGLVRRLNPASYNAVRMARTKNLEEIINAFESDTQITVAEHPPRHVFVTRVSWVGTDRPFSSLGFYNGKTTLVSELILKARAVKRRIRWN